MNNNFVYLYVSHISFLKHIFDEANRNKSKRYLRRMFGWYFIMALIIPIITILPIVDLTQNQRQFIAYFSMIVGTTIFYFSALFPITIYYLENIFVFSFDEPEQSLTKHLKKNSKLMNELQRISSEEQTKEDSLETTKFLKCGHNQAYLILDTPEPIMVIERGFIKTFQVVFDYLIDKRILLRDYTETILNLIQEDVTSTTNNSKETQARENFKNLIYEFKDISENGLSSIRYTHTDWITIMDSFTATKVTRRIKNTLLNHQNSFENQSRIYDFFKNEARKRKTYIEFYKNLFLLFLCIFLLFFLIDKTQLTSAFRILDFLELSWFSKYAWWLQPIIIISVALSLFLIPFFLITISFIAKFLANYFLIPIIFNYAETLCLFQLLLLNLDLQQDELFSIPEALRLCERRINYIRVLCRKIPYQYSYGSKNEMRWSQKHFEQISIYLSIRQMWLRSPTKETHEQLKKDFVELLEIFASKHYGEFAWQGSAEKQALETKAKDKTKTYIKIFILSISVGGLTILHQHAGTTPILYSYILISLILYLVDDLCNLDILNNIIEITRNIIDLNK